VGDTFGVQKWDNLGAIFLRCDNPDGHDIPDNWVDGVLLDDVPKIPADIWSATIRLYMHFLERDDLQESLRLQNRPDAGLEVAVFFTYNPRVRSIQAWCPTQAISGASVEIDYLEPIVNLLTGMRVEEGVNGLGDDEMKRGTSHSHNFMGAFFSGTDDRNELPQPGIHIVAGEFKKNAETNRWTYTIASSVVVNGRRYRKILERTPEGVLALRPLEYRDLIDFDTESSATFHASCLDMITVDREALRKERPAQMSRGTPTTSTPGAGWWGNEWDGQHSTRDDMAEYYRKMGYKSHRDTYVDAVCAECKGRVSGYSGYCWECYLYVPDKDNRGDEEKRNDEADRVEAVYDKDGVIDGYRIKDTATSWRYHYDTAQFQFKRLARRHGWQKTAEPLLNASGKSKKALGIVPATGEGVEYSGTHHSLDSKKSQVAVNAAMSNANVIINELNLQYELKEFDGIVSFVMGLPKDARIRALKVMRLLMKDYDLIMFSRMDHEVNAVGGKKQ
jgi:hypothetical protein